MNQRMSSISGEETEYFGLIPVDLVISNIFSRLPLESLAQCRCVSKLWSSIIRRHNNNILFPIKSQAPPRILFTIEYERELFVYSSPQPHNPDDNTSLVATLHHKTRGLNFSICRPPVGGLVCRKHYRKNPSAVAVISNPITGQVLALPRQRMDEIKSVWFKEHVRYSNFAFGYDPIDKEFKILRIVWFRESYTFLSSEYQVLTLGTEDKNLLWRNIQCFKIHYPYGYQDDNTICINGVLYYQAGFLKGTIPCSAIACFDVRSETFSFINFDQDMAQVWRSFTFRLIDYNGKLGACDYDSRPHTFELWVLEDAKKHEWSKRIYQMLPFPNELSYGGPAGMISSCEIVLYPNYSQDPFFFLYYNLETNIVTRVNIEVPILHSGCRVHAFPNYVEDLTLI